MLARESASFIEKTSFEASNEVFADALPSLS
jgi:hypothetical protein